MTSNRFYFFSGLMAIVAGFIFCLASADMSLIIGTYDLHSPVFRVEKATWLQVFSLLGFGCAGIIVGFSLIVHSVLRKSKPFNPLIS